MGEENCFLSVKNNEIVKITAICVQRCLVGGISDRTLQEIYVHKTTDAWYRSFSGQFDKESTKGRQYKQRRAR